MPSFGRLPWFVPPAFALAAAAALAIVANMLVGPYFERTYLDEASPLAEARATPVAAARPDGSPAASRATPAAGTPPAPEALGARVLARGTLRDGEPGHNGEGTVQVIRTEDGALFLRFEEFSVTNGPDLFVVLSPDAGGYADASLNLGGLKATDGNVNYEIPAGTDLSQYRSAVIWCRAFDVTFAVAKLEGIK